MFLLCVAAAWVSILVLNIESWVDFYRIARTGLARTPAGYVYHELLTVGIAMVVLGVPAACIGAVLPLMIRAVSADGKLLGKKVGALLTANTLGCVVGVMFTGFVLMPWLGLRNAFAALRPRGTLVQVGVTGDVTIPLNMLVGKEITWRGSQRFHAEFADAVRLIGSRAIDVRPIISHSLPLERAAEAFDLASDRSLACKVQLSFAQ